MKEWQIAEGSSTAHVIDTDSPSWKNEDGSRRRSGPRSVCGRYPQRNAEYPWLTMAIDDPEAERVITLTYHRTMCADCKEKASA